MNKTVLNAIIEHLFGHKYYANIINTRGTKKCEIACFIFHTKEEAAEHCRTLQTTLSYMFIETVSFRSRMEY